MQQKVYYQITGLNFNKFLQLLKSQNIKTYNFKKINYNTFYLGVNKNAEKTLLAICNKLNYTYVLKSQTFLPKIIKTIKSNIALTLTTMLLLLITLVSNNIVYKVQVYGLETIPQTQITQVLTSNGFTIGKTKSSYNLNQINKTLKSNIPQISLVSSVIKGNTLIININEKLPTNIATQNYEPLVSPYNIIITNINLFSGTPQVKIGDTVKQGEVIIAPYIVSPNGTKVKCKASAEVEAYVELSTTTIYHETHTELQQTSNKVTSSSVSLFGINFNKPSPPQNFTTYKTITEISYPFKNFFVPIIKITTTYCELAQVTVTTPFNKVMQNIIEQNKNLLYNNIYGKNVHGLTFETTTTIINNAYYVTTFLKTNIVLTQK